MNRAFRHIGHFPDGLADQCLDITGADSVAWSMNGPELVMVARWESPKGKILDEVSERLLMHRPPTPLDVIHIAKCLARTAVLTMRDCND